MMIVPKSHAQKKMKRKRKHLPLPGSFSLLTAERIFGYEHDASAERGTVRILKNMIPYDCTRAN